MSNNELKAKASKQIINVPIGLIMGGYGQRTSGCIGVHDNLFTKAIALSNGDETVVIITNDLLGVDGEMTDYIRNEIRDKYNIPQRNIMITASHTHSGPGVIPWDLAVSEDGGLNEYKKYKMDIAQVILANALNSLQDLKPAMIGFGKSECSTVGSNRTNSKGVSDNSVGVLNIVDMYKRPIAILVNYACHPTVMGADNLYISADYPGVMQAKLEESYSGAVAMFTNGACGNQSTRFTRKGQGFGEVERFGTLLYESVLEAIEGISNYESLVKLSSYREIVNFPKKQLPKLQDAQETREKALKAMNKAIEERKGEGEIRLAITRYQGSEVTLKMIELMKEDLQLLGEIHLIGINNINLAGVPVELFAEFGIKIKEKLGINSTLIIGYANNVLGYVYTTEALNEGGYEVLASPFAPETGEVIVEKLIGLKEKIQ